MPQLISEVPSPDSVAHAFSHDHDSIDTVQGMQSFSNQMNATHTHYSPYIDTSSLTAPLPPPFQPLHISTR